jgi:hypothetical protein
MIPVTSIVVNNEWTLVYAESMLGVIMWLANVEVTCPVDEGCQDEQWLVMLVARCVAGKSVGGC